MPRLNKNEKYNERKDIPLKPRELIFVEKYVANGGNATQAVIDSPGFNTSTRMSAGVTGFQLLDKPNVREYLESIAHKSAKNIEKLADNAENEGVKLAANRDILDRAGYKAIEKTMNLNVNVKDTKELQDLADKLNAIELHSGTSEPGDGASDSHLD